MKGFLKSRFLVLVIVLLIASLACASLPSLPAIPTFPPKPGTSNVPTGPSPMSGDWNANTDFGRIAFTVDPNGNNVVTTVIEYFQLYLRRHFPDHGNADIEFMVDQRWRIFRRY